MIYGFMVKHRGIWPAQWMCEMLDVSPSGFYEWLQRAPSKRAREDAKILVQVRASFAGSDETYGSRRVWRDLLPWGIDCGLHRVKLLMRVAGLKARKARRRKPYDIGERHTIAPQPAGAAIFGGRSEPEVGS